MSDLNRVFVTGVGALSAGGQTSDALWDTILAGETGIAPIQNADLSTWTYQLGGELKSYEPRKMLPDRKLLKAISRQDVLGINAAMQALAASGLPDYQKGLESTERFNDETGVYVGSPGNKYYQQYDFLPLMAKTNGNMHAFGEQFMDEVHPMWLLRILPNNVLAYVGISCGFKGANHNVVNHATGGMQALIEAYHAIQAGDAERIVVVAYDVGTDEQALFYYERLGLLSAEHLNPFDVSHNGTILAEGAAALVLESEKSIAARGATPYAELTGGLARTESAGLFSIEEGGARYAKLMQDTLNAEALTPNDLACIIAHGNGNPKSDITEAAAIQQLQGDVSVPVTAFKWAMGHTLCASGVMDAVLATHLLRSKTIPGLPEFQQAATGCEALNLSNTTRTTGDKQHVLILNRGFGSMNTSLVMKACD
ncbi:MAG: beta-ketoacyl synthase N-terminal-like domain-containing protein [Legionellaceae bacterium]|nr:beta-ketoacyl synthase N-terminal-like domain-containing protein [Legionellaceae bacterium]